MTVLTVLPDGRVIARAAFTSVVLGASGNAALTASVTDLRKVEYVLQFNITTSPARQVRGPRDAKIDGNAVGVTVYVAGATTVGGECICIGF